MRMSDWSSDVCSSDLVEAFLRWRDVDGKLKSPAAVIPVAEQHGLIGDLTEIVIAKALDQHGIWRRTGQNFTIAINVSMQVLNRYDFPEFVVAAAERAGVSPTSIVLEITESQIMDDIVKPLEVLSRLRLKGRSEEHTSELQSLMRISYAVFCLKKKQKK